jgi:hypothetical protein
MKNGTEGQNSFRQTIVFPAATPSIGGTGLRERLPPIEAVAPRLFGGNLRNGLFLLCS